MDILFAILVTLILVVLLGISIVAGLSEIWEYKKLKQRNKQQ